MTSLPPRTFPVLDDAGTFTLPWWDWFIRRDRGITSVVPVAKLTGGGTNGSLTFTNGILTSKVDPT